MSSSHKRRFEEEDDRGRDGPTEKMRRFPPHPPNISGRPPIKMSPFERGSRPQVAPPPAIPPSLNMKLSSTSGVPPPPKPPPPGVPRAPPPSKPPSFSSESKQKSYQSEKSAPPVMRPKGGFGIAIKLGAGAAAPKSSAAGDSSSQSTKTKTKASLASVFNADDSSDEEEMPMEAKMRMRNVGRQTITSSGPNSFGKTSRGFTDTNKLFEKQLKEAMDAVSNDNTDLPMKVKK